IMKSQARIEGLSTQVRSIYRPQQESLQPIELNEVIVDTVDLYSYQLGKNNIACELDLTAADTTISGNAKLLYTLIGNLLSNSIDAVAKNGRVLIQTRTENGKVQLRVEDNGAGIPAEIRDRIFEPFFTTKDPELGTGLGLYLVDEATKKLGGAIILNGGPESGAVFEVTLPMVDNSNKSDS
ncbi:MAG: sensor histidine kinase, partial [bacterium]